MSKRYNIAIVTFAGLPPDLEPNDWELKYKFGDLEVWTAYNEPYETVQKTVRLIGQQIFTCEAVPCQ